MHDRNGTELKVGDIVSIDFVITHVAPGPDYCNITARSVLLRKPDSTQEWFTGNSAVTVLRERAPPENVAFAPGEAPTITSQG